MEFLNYNEIVEELAEWGVVPELAGDLVHFKLTETDRDVEKPVCLAVGPAEAIAEAGSDLGDARRIESSADRIPGFIEDVIHDHHISEVVIVPASNWGAIVNLVVYDLTEDASWQQIDAEASLHQTRRDPLAVGAADMHLVKTVATSLIKHADEKSEEINILATGSALVMRLERQGLVRVWCPTRVVADAIAEIV